MSKKDKAAEDCVQLDQTESDDDKVVLKITGAAVDIKIEVAKNRLGNANLRRPIGVMIK